MTKAIVAAVQMVSGRDLQKNLNAAGELIKQAAEQGAQLVVLPEVFAMFATSSQLPLGIEEAFGKAPVRKFLCETARQFGVWLVGGSIPIAEELDDQRVYAASLLINAQGEEVAQYNKIHLFDVDVDDKKGSYRESDTFKAGDRVVVVDTPVGKLGMAVCYDLRFPEFFRLMFAQGAEIISLPSAFTKKTGEAHWLPLIQARAIENQCYVIGANQGGDHGNNRETSGGSVVVDAWGQVLAQADKGERVITAEIDLQKIQTLKAAMPIRQHQRFQITPQ